MTRSVLCSFPVLVPSAALLANAGCSNPGASIDRAGPAASVGLVNVPPLQMVPIQEPIQPARLAGFSEYYAPRLDTPDHEMSWTRTETGPLRQVRSTIRRHGRWVRRDWTDEGLANSEVIHLPTGITVSEARDATGQVVVHSIRAVRPDTSGLVDYGGGPTGVRQERLGEPCEDHVVYSGDRFRSLACVTSNGISVSEHIEGADGEVWSTSSAFATHLTRRAVAADLMQPPWFDREAWLGDPAPDASEDGENYTVLLESQRDGSQFLMRRRQGWVGEERRNRDGSATISARNSARGRRMVARLGPGARPEEVVYSSRATIGPGEGDVEKLDRPGETILGQFCDWYDVMPNVHDLGRFECRTSDGMPLRIQIIARGSVRVDAVATRLDRRQSAVGDVLPPRAWSSPQHWGVPAPDR